jgi:conjugal transfer pilus assembly protein TraU
MNRRLSSRLTWVLRVLVLAGVYQFAPSAGATCTDNTFMDPISDPAWQCIFPISIMGIPIDFGDHPPDSPNSQMLCECPGQGIYGLGFMVGFWEPARVIETVGDAWCFPTLGMSLNEGGVAWGYSGGGTLRSVNSISFQHYHYYIMPLWAVLDLFTDIPCVTDSDEVAFDLAMASEVRPDWHDDLYALQLFPETALMANSATVIACAVDAVAATFERTIDAMYWCMGSWGVTYPATGHITTEDYVAANAGIAAKGMFVQARTGNLVDRAVNYCAATRMPIWIKSHWRIQEIDPAVDGKCHMIGHPGILWTQRKNPVGRQDNFSWMLFRKVSCCVVVF